mmetsp:Transcript_247/g.444  ORF Transcript_247/g.444 Transcript_247/m.444 type:complete len:88 (+) Transcript_247:382-645(+)
MFLNQNGSSSEMGQRRENKSQKRRSSQTHKRTDPQTQFSRDQRSKSRKSPRPRELAGAANQSPFRSVLAPATQPISSALVLAPSDSS